MTTARTRTAPAGASDVDASSTSFAAAERLIRRTIGSRNGNAREIDRAVRRGRSLTEAGLGSLSPVALLSDLLPVLCHEGHFEPAELDTLVDELADRAGTPRGLFRVQLAQSAIAGRAVLEQPAESRVERALAVLLAVTPTRAISLWEADESGTPTCSAHAGQFPAKRSAELAGRALEGGRASRSTGVLIAMPLIRGGHAAAALIARPEPNARSRCEAVLRELAPVLAVVLERHPPAERAAATERVLIQVSERRLARLAFDLHDGPLQNVSGIAGDLAMLRRRLHGAVPDPQARLELLGCIDDLEARLRATDAELRDISHSLESPPAARVPFAHLLQSEVDAFRRRSDIRPGIEIEGDFGDLTESQRIALWRILQESLTNVRDHSCAREVRVKAVAAHDRLTLTVTDDGHGFDVPQTLLDAARRGRLGLVGVSERVRLLGGRCEIRSAPSGPTTISVMLPRWQPENLAST